MATQVKMPPHCSGCGRDKCETCYDVDLVANERLPSPCRYCSTCGDELDRACTMCMSERMALSREILHILDYAEPGGKFSDQFMTPVAFIPLILQILVFALMPKQGDILVLLGVSVMVQAVVAVYSFVKHMSREDETVIPTVKWKASLKRYKVFKSYKGGSTVVSFKSIPFWKKTDCDSDVILDLVIYNGKLMDASAFLATVPDSTK